MTFLSSRANMRNFDIVKFLICNADRQGGLSHENSLGRVRPTHHPFVGLFWCVGRTLLWLLVPKLCLGILGYHETLFYGCLLNCQKLID